MLHLYDHAESGNCYKIRLLLTHLGIPFTREELSVVGDRDAQRGESYFEKTTTGKIPALVLDDGTVLVESASILWYFAEGTEFLPGEKLDRARVVQWLTFEQNSIEPAIAVARHQIGLEKETPSPEQLAAWQAGGHRSLRVMERHLTEHDWFVGGRYSIADIAVYGYTHVASEGGFELDAYPAVRAWHERVTKVPGHIGLRD